MILRLLRALSLTPPPVLFVVPLMVGLRLHAWHPVTLVPASAAELIRGAGLVLIAAGAAIAVSAVTLFVRHRTTIVPHHRSRALVTGGPFRFTRNPMYLALATVHLGVALLANALWPLLMLALPLTVLQLITIPREEKLLRDAFATDYPSYAARVRRWL